MPPAKEGDLIELISMGSDDPCPIPPGTKGRIESIIEFPKGSFMVSVRWGIDRSLSLVCPPDQFRVVGSIGQILAEAQAETNRLKAEGWTQKDFARALGDLLNEPGGDNAE